MDNILIKNIGTETIIFSGGQSVTIAPKETKQVDNITGTRLLEIYNTAMQVGERVYKENGEIYLGHFSPYNTKFGYGVGGMSWLRALTKNGVNIKSWQGALGNQALTEDLQSLPEIDKELVKETSKRKWLPKYVIAHTLPTISTNTKFFRGVTAENIISHTMWEGNKLPPSWADSINKTRGLILPSAGLIDIFRESGVVTPIHIAPYPIETKLFQYKTREKTDTFTFFTWGILNDRKCPYETISCFLRAFPRDKYPNVRLIMKSNLVFGNQLLGVPKVNDDRVSIIVEHWSPEKLLEAIYNANACIFLTRGEGFQIPVYEAALSGSPVIACNNTAVKDFCGLGNLYNVETKELAQAFLTNTEGDRDIKWFEPDYEQAIGHMRDIYNNYEKAIVGTKKMNTAVRKMLNNKTIITNLLQWIDTLDE